jgi:hypothetical protein
MYTIAAVRNPWDRGVAFRQALGVSRDVFERPANSSDKGEMTRFVPGGTISSTRQARVQ